MKTELYELFRCIIWHTDDPMVFMSIALTCKTLAKLCHEYSPYKKNKFCKEIVAGKYKYKILPNGAAHCIMLDKFHNIVYNTGLCKFNCLYVSSLGSNDLETYKLNNYDISRIYKIFRGNFEFDLTVSDSSVLLNKSRIGDAWHAVKLKFYTCDLCNRIHMFKYEKIFYGMGGSDTVDSIYFTCNCLGKNLNIYFDTTCRIEYYDDKEDFLEDLDDLLESNSYCEKKNFEKLYTINLRFSQKRLRIAKAVIKYAKDLKGSREE